MTVHADEIALDPTRRYDDKKPPIKRQVDDDDDKNNDDKNDDDDSDSRVLVWALTGLALALAIVWVGKKINDIWDLPLEMILRYPEGPPPS